MTCVNCHGTTLQGDGGATENCLTCHKSGNGNYYYGKVDEKGDGIEKEYKGKRAHPEDGDPRFHQGQVRCTVVPRRAQGAAGQDALQLVPYDRRESALTPISMKNCGPPARAARFQLRSDFDCSAGRNHEADYRGATS